MHWDYAVSIFNVKFVENLLDSQIDRQVPQRAKVTENAIINTSSPRERQIHNEAPLSWLGRFGNDPEVKDMKCAQWGLCKWAQHSARVTLISKVGIYHLWAFIG